MFSKVYVVSLERRKDKRDSFLKELEESNLCSAFGGTDVKIIDGVDGLELTYERMSKLGFKPLESFRDPNSGRYLTWGEIGCAMSHFSIWEKVAKLDEPVLILEDDIEFVDNFLERLEETSEASSNLEYDLFYLGRKQLTGNEELVTDNIVCAGFSWWTSSYIITPECAKNFIESDYKEKLIPVDNFLQVANRTYPSEDVTKCFNVKQIKALSVLDNLATQIATYTSSSDTEKSDVIQMFDKPMQIGNKKFMSYSVGTEENDPIKRLTDSYKYYGTPHKILGLGKNWSGGDMASGPGGAQKIRILKEEIEKIEDTKDLVLMVTDGYDVITAAPPQKILEKFLEKNCKILFAAEKSCWPDAHLSEKFVNSTGSEYAYLNSGVFIGYADSILELVKKFDGIDSDDDQRFYTSEYLKDLHADNMPMSSRTSSGFLLDNKCEIFQCMAFAEDDVTINSWQGKISNNKTGTNPLVIHGNGPEETKVFFNTLCNFIGGNHLQVFGSVNHIDQQSIKNADDSKIFIDVFFTGEEQTIDAFCDGFLSIAYPDNMMSVTVICPSASQESIRLRLDPHGHKNILWKFADCNDPSLRDRRVEAFKKSDADYYFSIDSNIIIQNSNIIQNLLYENKGIVGPLAVKEDTSGWSNMWLGICPSGWYKRNDQYIPIVQYRTKGIFNVPYLTGCYLISKECALKIKDFFSIGYRSERGFDMTFCQNMRLNNMFMYVTNKINACKVLRDFDAPALKEVKQEMSLVFEVDDFLSIDGSNFITEKLNSLNITQSLRHAEVRDKSLKQLLARLKTDICNAATKRFNQNVYVRNTEIKIGDLPATSSKDYCVGIVCINDAENKPSLKFESLDKRSVLSRGKLVIFPGFCSHETSHVPIDDTTCLLTFRLTTQTNLIEV